MAPRAIDPGQVELAVARSPTPGSPGQGSDVFLDARPFTPLAEEHPSQSSIMAAIMHAKAAVGETTTTPTAVPPSPSRLSNLTLTPDGASSASLTRSLQDAAEQGDDDELVISPPFPAVDEGREPDVPPSSASLPPPLQRADSLRSSDPVPSKAVLDFRAEAGGSGPSRSHSNASSSAPSSTSNAPSSGAAAASIIGSEHETGSSLGRSGSWASTVPTSPEMEIASAPLPPMGSAAKELDADAELVGLSPTPAVEEEEEDAGQRLDAADDDRARERSGETLVISDDSDSASKTPIDERRPRAALRYSDAGSGDPARLPDSVSAAATAEGSAQDFISTAAPSTSTAHSTVFVPSDFARDPLRESSLQRQSADQALRPGAMARLQIRSEEHLVSSSDEGQNEAHLPSGMIAATSATVRSRNGRPPTAPSAWRDKPLPPLNPQPDSPPLVSFADIPEFIRQFYADDGVALDETQVDTALDLHVSAPLPSLRLEESQAFQEAVANGTMNLKPPMSQRNGSQASSLGSHSGGSSPSVHSQSPAPPTAEGSPRRNALRSAFARSSKYLWRQSLSGEGLEAAAAVAAATAARLAADEDSPRSEIDELASFAARLGLDGKRQSLNRGSTGSQLSVTGGMGANKTRLSSASSLSGVSSGDGQADSVAALPSDGGRARSGSRAGGLFHRHSKVASLTNAVQTSELRSRTPSKESSRSPQPSSMSKRFSLHEAGGWSRKKSDTAGPSLNQNGVEEKGKSPVRPALSRKSTRSIDGLSAMLSRDKDGASASTDVASSMSSSSAARTPDEAQSPSEKSKGAEMDRNGSSKSNAGHRRHRSQDAASALLSRGMSFLGSGNHTVKVSSSSSLAKRDLDPESRRSGAWWGGDVARDASPRAPELSEFAAANAALSTRPSQATLRPSKLPVPSSSKPKSSAPAPSSTSTMSSSGTGNAHRSFKSFFEPLSGRLKGTPGGSRPSSPAVSERTSSRQGRSTTSLGFSAGRAGRDTSSRPNALTSDSIKGLMASRGVPRGGGRSVAGSVASSAVTDATFVTALTSLGPATGGRSVPRTTVTPAAPTSSRLGSKAEKAEGLTSASKDKSSTAKASRSATGRAASALGHIRPKTAGSSTTSASRSKVDSASKPSTSLLMPPSKRSTSGANDKLSVASFAAEPSPPPRTTSVAGGMSAKRRSLSSRSSQNPPSSPSRHFAAAAAAGMLPKSTSSLETAPAPAGRSGALRPSLTVDTMSATPSASDSALVTDDSAPTSPALTPVIKRKYSQPTLSIIDDHDFLQALEDVRQQHRERAARRDSGSKTAASPRERKKKGLAQAEDAMTKRPSLKRETRDVGVTPRRPRALSADGRLISPGLIGAEFFSASPTSSRGDGGGGSPETPRTSPQRELPQTPLERGVGRASGKLGESALLDDGDWKKEVKALFVIRELVQTERSYARHLESLLQAVNRTIAPEPHPSLATRRRSSSGLLTLTAVSSSSHAKPASRSSHLVVMRKLIPQLIALSRALAASIDENPTAAGVGLAFRVMAPQLEASFLAWSEAVEGVMAALRYTEGPKGVKSRDRLGLISLPPAEDGSPDEPVTYAGTTLAGPVSMEQPNQGKRRASGPAEIVSAHSPGESSEILAEDGSVPTPSLTPGTTSNSSRAWKRRSTITTPSSAASAIAVVKAEAAASAAASQTSFEESPPIEPIPRAHSAWGFASKRAFGTAGAAALTRPAPKGRSATMAPNTPSNGRKALSALDIAIMPTQRLPRYLLLLRDLIANTPPASLTYARCAKALDILRHVAKLCDEASSNASPPNGHGISTAPRASGSRSLTASSSSFDTTPLVPTPAGSVSAALKTTRPIWR